MKIDFRKVAIRDIEGRDVTADFQKQIGNQLYMSGHNIGECELGKRIYFAEDGVELTDKEADVVRRAVSGYSYVARTAIEKMLDLDNRRC